MTWKDVVSPSKQISCYAVKHGAPAIVCSATYLPRLGQLDPYFLLKPRGRTF